MTLTVLIAGAGPGVSGSLARLYAAEGARLLLLGADDDALATLAGEVEAAGGSSSTRVVDLTDDTAARATIAEIVDAEGDDARLDVVHFNPSAYREQDPLELSVDGLLDDVRLGVGALLTLVQAARPYLHDGARITATGSEAADKPWFGAASLGVQKAGMRNLVRSIDTRLREDGIRAVSVTVCGLLAKEGPFAPDRVAEQLRAAVEQGGASGDDWRVEVRYEG